MKKLFLFLIALFLLSSSAFAVIAPKLTAVIRNSCICQGGFMLPTLTQTVDFGQSTGPDQTGNGLITKTFQGGAYFTNPGTSPVTFTPPFASEKMIYSNGQYSFVAVTGTLTIPAGESVTLRKKV